MHTNTEYHSAKVYQSRSEVPKPQFLVDDKGHLSHRKKDAPNSFRTRETQCGGYSFTFTPVGYNEYTIKPNCMLEGVRPDLRDTSKFAYQFVHKPQNVQRKTTSFINKSW